MSELKVKLPIRIIHVSANGVYVIKQYINCKWRDVSSDFTEIDDAYAALGRMTLTDTNITGEIE